ncbi:hypothetical protein [Phenylobacterium deserti]|nr:hypothetical protein [Phenylobacterium deserti]
MAVLSGLAALAAAVSGAAQAQTAAQAARLDQLARYAVETPFCARLGFQVEPHPEPLFDSGFKREAVRSGMYFATAERGFDKAVQRHADALPRRLAQAQAESSAALAALLASQGELCSAAAADPIFARIVKQPAGYEAGPAVAQLSAELLARPSERCAFSRPPMVLLEEGDPHQPGSRWLQVWEVPDTPVLWSQADPDGYQAFRAAVARHVDDPDPLRRLAEAGGDAQHRANNARVAASAVEWIRPARCLQKLLQLSQHERIDTFTAPTEFAAFILRSPDKGQLRIYAYTVNQDGIGRMDPLTDPVIAARKEGWEVLAGLHNHAFHPGRPALNGPLAPSLPDAQFNSRFAEDTGMQSAWITNGLHTVEIPASAFPLFEQDR